MHFYYDVHNLVHMLPYFDSAISPSRDLTYMYVRPFDSFFNISNIYFIIIQHLRSAQCL